MPTIGQKLEETRRSRGLALEDVARATRIHPSVLARIESDDFSQFPSVSYARSFLRLYGRHLGLDLEEALAALSARDARFSERQLMEEMRQTLRAPRRRFRLVRLARLLRRPVRRRNARPILLDALLLLLFAAIGLFYFLGYQAPTPEQATEDIARALGLPSPSSGPGAAPDSGSAPPAPQLPSDKRVEPRAALRPEVTDPAADAPRLPETVPDPAAPSPEVDPETGLRAVPVASSR